MCVDIFANNGDIIIETPRQMKELLGVEPIKHEYYTTIDPECCLCQVDIEASLTKAGLAFTHDCGDIVITDTITPPEE